MPLFKQQKNLISREQPNQNKDMKIVDLVLLSPSMRESATSLTPPAAGLNFTFVQKSLHGIKCLYTRRLFILNRKYKFLSFIKIKYEHVFCFNKEFIKTNKAHIKNIKQ